MQRRANRLVVASRRVSLCFLRLLNERVGALASSLYRRRNHHTGVRRAALGRAANGFMSLYCRSHLYLPIFCIII